MTSIAFLSRGQRRPRLAYALHEPQGEARAAVLLTHGYAEHMGRYDAVIASWTSKGLLVVAHDLRGHGRSDGPRGHVDAFTDYVDDVYALLDSLGSEPRFRALGRPILFGHSLGGLVSAHVALRDPGRFRGLALTSPFFGLATRVPPLKEAVGRVVAKVFPRLKQPSGLQGSDLTHDAELVARYDSDPFHFSHVTVGWFTETARAQEALHAQASGLTLPLFCLAAGADRVVAVEATKKVFAAAKSSEKELVVLDGLYHEVLNELDRGRHIETLSRRMLEFRA
jgi:alpha-beta hydrolase superfamily lysophospholipase